MGIGRLEAREAAIVLRELAPDLLPELFKPLLQEHLPFRDHLNSGLEPLGY